MVGESVVDECEFGCAISVMKKLKLIHDVFGASHTKFSSVHSNRRAEFAPVGAATARYQVEYLLIFSEVLHRPEVPSWEGDIIQILYVRSIWIPHNLSVFSVSYS